MRGRRSVVKQLVLVVITTVAAHGQGVPPYDPLKDHLYRGYLLATIIGVSGD